MCRVCGCYRGGIVVMDVCCVAAVVKGSCSLALEC